MAILIIIQYMKWTGVDSESKLYSFINICVKQEPIYYY